MPVAVPFVSVSFADRAEEIAYRDGAFVYPYLASTRTDDTFSLVRTGGWPSTPSVHVEEQPEPVVPDLVWGALYSADYAALPATSFATAQAYTIGGLDWWLKGTFTQSGGVIQSSDLDGTGLRIRTNFSSEGTPAATNLRWFLPLANIPGYNPALPLAVWARLTSTSSATNANAILGFCSAAASSDSLTSPERATRNAIGSFGASTTAMNVWLGDTTASISHTLAVAPVSCVYGMQLLSPTTIRRIAGLFSAAPENSNTVTDKLSAPAATGIGSSGALTPETTGLYFATNFNGGSTQDFHLRNLYIMQPIAVLP
jgi:hypothetical protein